MNLSLDGSSYVFYDRFGTFCALFGHSPLHFDFLRILDPQAQFIRAVSKLGISNHLSTTTLSFDF